MKKHRPIPEDAKNNIIKDLLSLILPFVGILLIISKFWLPLGNDILPIFGFFLLLYWLIVNAQVNRARLSELLDGYFASLSKDEETRINIRKVLLYTFFCLLPLHAMLVIPTVLAISIGEIASWVFLGIPFLFISAFAMWGFSAVWKDVNLKPIFFWIMQVLIFVAFNGFTFIICFI